MRRRSNRPSPPQIRRLAPQPAPADLESLLALLNTAERFIEYYGKRRGWREKLPNRDALERWLADQDIVPEGTELSLDEHRRTLALRDAILQRVGTEDTDEPETLRRLREFGGAARFRVCFDDEGSPDLEAVGDGLESAFATWLWLLVSAVREGRWERVKRCEGCLRIFYDHAPSRITKYCTTRCGDRIRGRRRKTPRKRDYPKKERRAAASARSEREQPPEPRRRPTSKTAEP
jgi:hypothetical protein